MTRPPFEPQIISTSTILILSGVIIGMTLSRFASPSIEPFLVIAGLTGILSFIVLDLASMRRTQAALRIEQAQVEDRLDKHMNSLTAIGFDLDPVSQDGPHSTTESNELPQPDTNELIASA